MPSSTTAQACDSFRRSSVSGRPISLLRLPGGGEHAIGAEVFAQARGDHFLDRRLAVGAGHRDHRQRETLAPVLGERAERETRVADDHQRQLPRLAGESADAIDHRRRCAAAARRVEILVAVEALAAQRDEQRARSDGAGVGRHRREHARRPRPRGRRSPGRPRRSPSCGPLQRSGVQRGARRVDVGVRMLHAGDFLVRLVALAGEQDHVAGAASSRLRAPLAARRSTSTSCATRTPGTISSMIARGSSPRGLSLVTMT